MSIPNNIRYFFFILLSFYYFIFIPNFTDAVWSPNSSINTPVAVNSNHQHPYKILSDENGSAYILYIDNVNGGGIYLQRINAEGELEWGEEGILIGRISTRASASARLSFMLSSSNTVVVVWEEIHEGRNQVFAQKINSNGNILWGIGGLLVSTTSNFSAFNPQAVADKDGGAIITWASVNSAGLSEIKAQRVSNTGELLWDAGGTSLAGLRSRERISRIVSNNNGGAYFLFRGNNNQTLLIQHIDADGNVLWPGEGKTLSTTTEGGLVTYEFISDNLGGAYVWWRSVVDGVRDIRYQRISGDGSYLWGDEGKIIENRGPIASDEAGNLYIFLTSNVSPWDTDLNIQKFNNEGVVQWNGDVVQIIQKAGLQSLNGFVLDSSGSLVVTWTDHNTTSEQQSSDDPNEPAKADIYAQRVDLNTGQLLWPRNGVVISNAEEAQTGSSVDQIDGAAFVLAWADTRNGNADIYAQKVNLDGTLGDSPTPTPEPCVLTHFPDPLLQTDDRWDEVSYGGNYEMINGELQLVPFKYHELNNTGKKDSIKEWGCNLTSHAMNINYYAKIQDVRNPDGSLFQTDPQILNDWLQRNNGYDTGIKNFDAQHNPYYRKSWVKSEVVSLYAKNHGVSLSYGPRVTPFSSQSGGEFTQANATVINDSMCKLQPGILKVQYPSISASGHFVAVSGIATVSGSPSWRIHDPYDEPDPITLYEKYNNTFYQYQLATSTAPGEYLSFALHSPAELVVTAPDGKKTGYNPITQISFSEIPGSWYGLETLSTPDGSATQELKLFSVQNPQVGGYKVEVIGTGAGEYALETSYSQDTKIIKPPVVSSKTKPAAHDTYFFEYSSSNDSPLPPVRQITIDFPIIPGNYTAMANSTRRQPITILSSSTFDATTIETRSVVAGPGRAIPLAHYGKTGNANSDGLPDHVLFFTLKELGITRETEEVCLEGIDNVGNLFRGCDAVETISVN